MSDNSISQLRQRMIEDMTARRFKEKVQKDYVRDYGGAITVTLYSIPKLSASACALAGRGSRPGRHRGGRGCIDNCDEGFSKVSP